MPQLVIFLVTLTFVAIAMMALAVGYLVRGRCIRGTCSTEGVIGPDGELLTCDTCPRRKEGECDGEHGHEHHAA
ncbi:MAG: hypothetical protein AMXMBFR84_19300 [Candidatus Hydrogenedentota bacterium]